MSIVRKKAKLKPKNFSKSLYELRNLALTITKNRKIRVKYDAKEQHSCYNAETNQIVLSLNAFPEWCIKHKPIAEKILDGDLSHECGHDILSKPIWGFYNNWVTKIKRNRGSLTLAKQIVNIVEDIRVNHFINLRYRFDLGKRNRLVMEILKDVAENALSKNPPKFNPKHGYASLMLGILTSEGLYGADCSKLWNCLSDSAKESMKKALLALEDMKYKRVKHTIIDGNQRIYDLIKPYLKNNAESSLNLYVTIRIGKGKLKGDISLSLKKGLKAQIKVELEEEAKKAVEKLLKDLLKGAGAGTGTGEEIPTPEPNFEAYSAILDRNKEEISRLLNKLKVTVKPILRRAIFQKRGRIMAQIQSKAYIHSLRHVVKNIYLNVNCQYEKEQVAVGFLIDYSGSVDRTEAEDITVILNEVFGHYVDDYGFSISCFGADSQKVKTFFETFENTKARCGNIGVNAGGTEISVLLTAYLKMFNAIDVNRRKILVIASDFWFGDRDEAERLIKLFPSANVELVFVGFCNCKKVYEFGDNLPKKAVRRTDIKNVHELPEKFLDVYLNVQK